MGNTTKSWTQCLESMKPHKLAHQLLPMTLQCSCTHILLYTSPFLPLFLDNTTKCESVQSLSPDTLSRETCLSAQCSLLMAEEAMSAARERERERERMSRETTPADHLAKQEQESCRVSGEM